MVDIEPLTPNDWRVWRELRLQALADAPQAFGSTLAEWSGAGDIEQRWRARLENVPFNAVARLDGALAGMIGATTPDDRLRIELISMWVAPFARGHGVGDALITAVTEHAASVDADVILRVYDDNVVASRLYERHGFAFNGLVEVADDDVRRELVMVRRRM